MPLRFSFKTVFIAFSLIAALLVLIAPWLIDKWGAFYGSPSATTAPLVGKIISAENNCQIRPLKDRTFQACQSHQPLQHLDTLKLSEESQAELSLSHDFGLTLMGPALMVVERWNVSDEASPLLLHLTSGELTLNQEGKSGQLYILKNGELLDAKGVSTKEALAPKIRGLHLWTGAPLTGAGTHSGELTKPPAITTTTSSPPSQNQERDGQKKEVPLANKNEQMPNSQGTLTNEYLDQRLAKEVEQFQKCQRYALRQQAEMKGQILVGLTIIPDGKVSEAQILTTTFENESLHNCVLQIFRRLTFTPFQGPPIVRSFPLYFEY